MNETTRNRLRGWLQLLRPPNLPTVPGDPLAGYLLASGKCDTVGDWREPGMAIGAALCLYACGLMLNDVADCDEDRLVRPDRPLPSGRVSRRSATLAAAVAAAAALALAFRLSLSSGTVACALLAAILCYTFLARRWAHVGIVTMGLCRGLSVLLGATAAGATSFLCLPVAVAALVITLYIVAVSAIAARETEHTRIGPKRFAPGLTGVGGLAAGLGTVGRMSYPALFWSVALAVRSGMNARRLRGTPQPAQVAGTIGSFIRDITLIQAAFCTMVPGGMWAGLAIAGMWPLSYLLARGFYGS